MEKAPIPAASAAAPTALSDVATAPPKAATNTDKTTRRRQTDFPPGARASRVYQTNTPEPRTIAAAKVATALTIAKGSIMIAQPNLWSLDREGKLVIDRVAVDGQHMISNVDRPGRQIVRKRDDQKPRIGTVATASQGDLRSLRRDDPHLRERRFNSLVKP